MVENMIFFYQIFELKDEQNLSETSLGKDDWINVLTKG